MITIERYSPALAAQWDAAVEASRNGTFLHLRPYMDYHADRFADFSLLARDAKGEVIAVLPANAEGDTVCSHRGLTFGGWLMTPKADAESMMEIWPAANAFLADAGFKTLVYKPVPHIYHKYPAEEDLYALFRAGGRLQSTLISSVVETSMPLGFDRSAKRYAKAAAKTSVEVSRSENWDEYWTLLTQTLAERHNAAPVHSVEEIRLLQSRFPENIKLYAASLDGRMLAGVVIYDSLHVEHCQYIAASPEGRDRKILPLIFEHLLSGCKAPYFDFGTSNEDGGRILNLGLIHQKCGFGARAIVYNTWQVPIG